ncbi:motility associated factor glycosyltransferase family protein [Psychrobacillus sp. L3]|uniref:motility associated factor glycosyltransferase family protein n=1 Tax=Psychrobacillus sp. L3 TaxID=3236891 RepID=UPI0036F30E27
MNYKVEIAKNGESTLKLNDIYIYSKYNPRNDAEKFIKKGYDNDAKGYFLVGLGLGYHLEALLKIDKNKPIIVLALDEQEFKIYSSNTHIRKSKNVEIILELGPNINLSQYQIIIPLSWMKAIGHEHRLHDVLEDIKIRQMSYETLSGVLEKNFNENLKNDDPSISNVKETFKGKSACLVSAGPSLDSTIELLKVAKDKFFILAVGSSLNTLLNNKIEPDAVIITDTQINVVKQLENKEYHGLLFYLATANHEMTLVHKGKRVIIFQEGFPLSEIEAEKRNEDVLETGGSVATTSFSLLEYMEFKTVILFGQDLGFKDDNTHSTSSTSGKKVVKDMLFRKVLANNGEYIHTTSNLNTYHRWLERKVKQTNVTYYNTSWEGAKIEGVPYISAKSFHGLLRNIKFNAL